MRKNFCAVFFLFLIFPSIAAADGSWKKEFTKNGITVYTRAVAGSDIREFRGICTIDADIETVNNALNDIPNLARWMPDCLVSKLIEKKSDSNLILYQVIKTPWPLDNRDFTFQSKIIKKPGTIVRTVKAVPHNSVPPVKKYVRITNMSGRWVLKSVNGKTRAIYQIRTDPAGNIPVSIANSSSRDLPYKTMRGLRKEVKKDKYRSK